MNNLNQLSEAELSAVFAVEVAGWIPLTKEWCEQHIWAWPRYKWATPNGYPYDGDAIFATSMDAVLPYLEKHESVINHYHAIHGLWYVSISPYFEIKTACAATDKILPRATCIALILAARAGKEAAK